jgi:hypothetical protein
MAWLLGVSHVESGVEVLRRNKLDRGRAKKKEKVRKTTTNPQRPT